MSDYTPKPEYEQQLTIWCLKISEIEKLAALRNIHVRISVRASYANYFFMLCTPQARPNIQEKGRLHVSEAIVKGFNI